MNATPRSATLRRFFFFFVFALVAVAGIFCAASPAALAAPRRSPTPTPTPAANADDDEDAIDPSKIVIPGTVLTRPDDKGYLSLALEGGSLKLTFYNKDKQPVAPDVARAAARWNPKQTQGEEHAVLNPDSDGQSLKGNRFVQPPFPLQIFITLLNEQGIGVENYTVMFKP
jgi:hypothetical protein